MNEYLKNLDRIEFVVTLACTGRCRHCQNGDPDNASGHIDPEAAVKAIRAVCARYEIRTLMTFGGEPLLRPEVVCAIHRAAADLGIGRRQIITNGYFSRDPGRIGETVRALADSGVNELILSVDAFHQETIPLEPVVTFAECALAAGIPLELNPAWLVAPEDRNPYNLRTREVLRAFEPLGVPVGDGNVVFPSGNALKYLREYFEENVVPFNAYDEDPADVRTLSFSPNGDLLNGNTYKTDVLELLETYRP